MAAASAAALHAPVRDEFLRSNVEPQLAACAARTGLAAVNVEALAADASRIYISVRRHTLYMCPHTYWYYTGDCRGACGLKPRARGR